MRAFILLSLYLLCTSSLALAEGAIGTVKIASGEVFIVRGEQEIAARPGLELLQSDMVRTGAHGAAGFTFQDGTRISMGASTELELASYAFVPKKKVYAFDMFMKKGSAVYSSGKLGKVSPESVSFRTPQATVGVRGTTFCIEVQ